jgi:hypothetical protein
MWADTHPHMHALNPGLLSDAIRERIWTCHERKLI